MNAAGERGDRAVGRIRMSRIWRGQRGAAVVEYVMVLPMLLFLFLGTLELFRLYSIKQSLRTGVKRALPCISHWRDDGYRAEYDCANIAAHIQGELARTMWI